MAANQYDKYRQEFNINSVKVYEGSGNLAREKLIKVISTSASIGTVIFIEAKTIGATVWSYIGCLTGTEEKVLDISMFDSVRYNVNAYSGSPSTLEVVSAINSDQNVVEKDINGNDALRIIDSLPVQGDNKTAYLNALLTLDFWSKTGIVLSGFNFVVTEDDEPVLDNNGKFVEI